MKKIVITLILTISLTLIGCSNAQPNLSGSYQSDKDYDGYIIQMTFQPDDNSFVEYIDNREVDKGTYKKAKNNIYELKSNKQSFEIKLKEKDTFNLKINKINEGKPIILENVDKTPTYSSTNFNDVELYKELLKEN